MPRIEGLEADEDGLQHRAIEDYLKTIYRLAQAESPVSTSRIARERDVKPASATGMVQRLAKLGLLAYRKREGVTLTPAGEKIALEVLRHHRLIEAYLIEALGFGWDEVHEQADLLEHVISEKLEAHIARALNHPEFDPHGDPIPSARGELPAHKGQPLSNLQEGEIAQILHIEDEPRTIYEQLTALGIYPGMEVYVMDVAEGKITFAANGEECTLTPLFAASITVELLPERPPLPPFKYELLSSLRLGEQAEVAGISPNCRGQQRRRLMDLGVVPGTIISAEFRSASSDPVAYRIMGATIAIRKDQASLIFINKKEALPNEQTSGL